MPEPTPSAPAAADEAGRVVEFLRDRDETCPVCGYNVRNSPTDACPECGNRLILTVGARRVYLKAWIVLLLAFSVTAGLGLTVLIVILATGNIPNPARGDYRQYAQGCLFYWVFCLLAAPAVAATREPFLRRPRATQWLMAAVPALLLPATLVTFILATVYS